MGPKQIQNEFVDGKLASPARTGLAVYNGRVMRGPGVDFNYEISSYTFDKPSKHTIQWKGGGHPIQADLKTGVESVADNCDRIEHRNHAMQATPNGAPDGC